jgi:hypothetical protein
VATKRFEQDPDAVLDYTLDWVDYLVEDDFIVDVAFTTSDVALVVNSENFTNTWTSVWLSGGLLAVSYSVVCHITTDAGRQDDRTFMLTIRQK